MIAPERPGGRYCLYRWHADNPVTFTRYLRHTMEHGHANDRADNFFSVAYWYQSEPYTDFPRLPPADARIPNMRVVAGPGRAPPRKTAAGVAVPRRTRAARPRPTATKCTRESACVG